MVLDILESGNVPEYHVMDGGIITVNTETAAALGIDYAAFSDMASQALWKLPPSSDKMTRE